MSTPLTLLQRLLQRGEQPSAEDAREYSVDELARAAGSSVRNVRAYQDRGLLPPPERRGRVGVYFDSHLKRLRLISQLLERGYSSANIKELLEAWEQGRDLDHVLGLDQATIGEWNLETPGSIGFDELQAIFGDELNDRVIDKAQALGLLLFDGERMKIPSPRLFQAGLELYRSGIPLEALLDQLGELRSDTEHLAAGIVRLIVTHLVDGRGTDLLPGAPDLQELAKVFLRLRPLAEHVVQVELARGLKLSANEMLGERVGEMLRKLEKPS
ncbi:MerR family transcriptional regulator [Pseudomonas aeruginosa]